MTKAHGKTLIIGGTGKTGRRVAERLSARGLPFALASRSSATPFDWANKSDWPRVFDGVDRVYLTYYPDLAVPGAADDIRQLSNLAAERGVRRIVLLSGRGEPQVLASERAVQESGVSSTILRCAWFAQNFSEGMLADAVNSGELAFPAQNVAEPFIDIDDVADVAVEALIGDGHGGTIYDLTGPSLVTFEEATSLIAGASGRSIRYLPVTLEQYGQVLSQHVPAEYVAWLCELFSQLLDGHNAHVSGDVERVLGRKATDFAAYAHKAAAQNAWRAS